VWWIALRCPQVMVVPISEHAYDYAREVRSAIRSLGVHVDADCSDRKMQKKAWAGVGLGPMLAAFSGMVRWRFLL
jgi:histidyl-tRNA synthetase